MNNNDDEYYGSEERTRSPWANPVHWAFALILLVGWWGYGFYADWVTAREEEMLQTKAELQAAYPPSESHYLNPNDDGSPAMVWKSEHDAFIGVSLLHDQVKNGFDWEKLKLTKEYLSCAIDTPIRVTVSAMKDYGLTITIAEGKDKGCTGFASRNLVRTN